MSPFSSLQQSKAAFSGALGSKMKAAAPQWAKVTNYKNLPPKVKSPGPKLPKVK